MKIRYALFLLIVCFFPLPAHAQEFGKIRALQQRADQVTKQKNDFIVKVLTSYSVPFELNVQGVVVRINTEGRWRNITSIEIVPVLSDVSETQQRVTAHELFFFTEDGILNLFSDLAIK